MSESNPRRTIVVIIAVIVALFLIGGFALLLIGPG